METQEEEKTATMAVENNSSSDLSTSLANHDNNHLPLTTTTNGDGESVCKLSAEEVKGALEITASTGKFWLDWEELKSMLYFQLKQVLTEYPEAKMSDDQQNSALGESYLQLVKKLEEALFSFVEGPPFTLQRLSEILLNARAIYPNLSKLALALEKNLLVTSTLTKSTDPYVPPIIQPVEQAQDTKPQPEPEIQQQPQPEIQQQPEPEESNPHSTVVENGELMTSDNDEVMTEAEVEVDATFDMEAYEKILTSPTRLPEQPSTDP